MGETRKNIRMEGATKLCPTRKNISKEGVIELCSNLNDEANKKKENKGKRDQHANLDHETRKNIRNRMEVVTKLRSTRKNISKEGVIRLRSNLDDEANKKKENK